MVFHWIMMVVLNLIRDHRGPMIMKLLHGRSTSPQMLH